MFAEAKFREIVEEALSDWLIGDCRSQVATASPFAKAQYLADGASGVDWRPAMIPRHTFPVILYTCAFLLLATF